MGEALARTGDEATGIAMVQAAEQQVQRRDWPMGKALAHNTRARMLAQAGRHGAARDAWLRAKAVATALSAGPASPLGQDLLRTEALIVGSPTSR
jgi:predicted RNA polymerase sigma factor